MGAERVSQNAQALISTALSVMAGAAPSLKAASAQPAQLSDWCPAASVIGMLDSMQTPDAAWCQSIVDALERCMAKANDDRRFGVAIDMLHDVHEALEPRRAHTDCDGCAGSGVNRHNGSHCIACGGVGEVAL